MTQISVFSVSKHVQHAIRFISVQRKYAGASHWGLMAISDAFEKAIRKNEKRLIRCEEGPGKELCSFFFVFSDDP